MTPDVSIDELVTAYQTLDLDLRASKLAIRARYRELAHVHHPDKWPQGSSEAASADRRMREINAAYELIQDAPLQHHTFPAPSIPSDPAVDRSFRLDRTVSVATETLIRFALGAAIGCLVVLGMVNRGVPGVAVYGWLLPFLLGWAFTGTSERTWDILRILWWLR